MNDLTLLRDVIAYIALVIGAILILKSKVKTENLNDLKERVGILEKELQYAKKEHMENQKAISNLEGQLQTYKEIPLKQIASSLAELSNSNSQILGVLRASSIIAETDRKASSKSSQHISEQIVENQTVKVKE